MLNSNTNEHDYDAEIWYDRMSGAARIIWDLNHNFKIGDRIVAWGAIRGKEPRSMCELLD